MCLGQAAEKELAVTPIFLALLTSTKRVSGVKSCGPEGQPRRRALDVSMFMMSG